MSVVKGRCICGGIEFSVAGPLRDIVYCHCKMCRRTSGHIVAATACAVSQLTISTADHLRWYQSSAQARRGFCDRCGANLFWQPVSGTHVSIMAGAIDDPTSLSGAMHIFVADRGDYYGLNDGLPQHQQDAPPDALPLPGRGSV